MKKLLLSGFALTLCLSLNAQNNARQIQSRLTPTTANKIAKVAKPGAAEIIPVRSINQTVSAPKSSMPEFSIGQTQYDLQSNYGTVGNRVKLWDDNTLSAVWTKGDDSPSFSDRGTGYNYFDGANWGPQPADRIETIRTGWPNVGGSATMGEAIVNHGTNPTNYVSRPVKGTGTWAEGPLGTTTVTWPRMVVGGANATSVHVIGNENTGSYHVLYSRSLDGGTTWINENVPLPTMATDFFEGPVDAYDIDARGDVIAIVGGGFSEDLTLWKSTDNGANWTTTTINAFPLSPFDYNTGITDIDGDGVADTVFTTDSGPSLVIDHNNMCHVAVGLMRVLDDDPAAAVSYFPGTDGLLYWNESMPAGDITNNIIAFAEDIDGSGIIELPDGLAIYQCSLTGMPTLGVDDNGNIHLAYSSIIENTTNGNPVPALEEAFRNVYYMYSTDNGATWNTPARVESTDFDEQVWPNMSKELNSTVHLTYHKDGEPGNTFQPSSGQAADPVTTYDVIYNGFANPVGIIEHDGYTVSTSIYPNPVKDVLNIDYTMSKPENFSIELVNVLGQTVYSENISAVTGINNVRVNVRDFASGIYSLNTIIGDQVYAEKVVIR